MFRGIVPDQRGSGRAGRTSTTATRAASTPEPGRPTSAGSKDSGLYSSSSLEWDFYGGFKGTFGSSDFTYDVGFLYYYYPGDVAPGFIKADTQETLRRPGLEMASPPSTPTASTTPSASPNSDGYLVPRFQRRRAGRRNRRSPSIAHYGIQTFDGSTQRRLATTTPSPTTTGSSA
ncbi:MAG: hypothetical protein MZW92_76545 [Comamonadaceae bacterium]|nr:hypothetical protein [Comamonadaceae bacterium]